MPIARIGSTATHPLAHYQGKADFLVDVPAFEGSSGSPVYSYETPLIHSGNDNYALGTKLRLLGIVWGVIADRTPGVMESREVPSHIGDVPVTPTSTNLALAHHAEVLRTIDELAFLALNLAAPQ